MLTEKQQTKLNEFLDNNHELTDARDLQYYHEATGKSLQWLVNNGKNICELIKTLINDGHDIDDIWDVIPHHNKLVNQDDDCLSNWLEDDF